MAQSPFKTHEIAAVHLRSKPRFQKTKQREAKKAVWKAVDAKGAVWTEGCQRCQES